MEDRESKKLYEKIKNAPMELSDNDLANIWGGVSPKTTIDVMMRIFQDLGIDMSSEDIAAKIAQGGCTLRNIALAKTGGNKMCNLIPCF